MKLTVILLLFLWDNVEFTLTLQALTCKLSLKPPVGTTYEPQNQMSFTPGQSVRVTCGDDQWVKNTELQTADLICQDTGEWDFDPACQRVTCQKIAEHVNWWERTFYRYWEYKTLRYRCDEGYEATSERATCTRRGWEPKPLCKELESCGSPPPLDNGDFIASSGTFDHNSRVQYQCQSKYTMQGGPHKTCLNGEWTGEIKCLRAGKAFTSPWKQEGGPSTRNVIYFKSKDQDIFPQRGHFSVATVKYKNRSRIKR